MLFFILFTSLAFFLNHPQFVIDQRDQQQYEVVQIGDLVWLKQNLNFDSPLSECYENDENNCTVYGKMYPYSEIHNICNLGKGWRVPTIKDWEKLKKVMRSKKFDSIILQDNWKTDEAINGTNELNLSILAAGRKDRNTFSELGISSSFWLDAPIDKKNQVKHWHIRWGKSHIHKHYIGNQTDRKFSIRCVCDIEDL